MVQKLMTLPSGAVIQGHAGERYMIEGVLGQGRESAVYLVRNRHNKAQQLALKELINPDAEERKHLAFEAELLMRLEHKGLPRIHKVFENVKLQRVYLVMDYIIGKNLEALREEQLEKCFSLPLTFALMSPIIDAIRYLHAQSPPIVHRDIKPANIIVPVNAGEAILVDFGLAKEFIEDKTTNVFRYGTAGYAAPEQYAHGTNPRTDIYALAATFYTLLAGTVPTDALTRTIATKSDPLQPIHKYHPTVPVAVSRVIQRAMNLRSEERYATINDFWEALHAAMEQQSDTAEMLAISHKTPYPFTIQPQEVQPFVRDSNLFSLSKYHNSRPWLFLLLTLLVIGLSASSILAAFAWQHTQSTAFSIQDKPKIRSTPKIHVAGCPLPPFTLHAPVSPLYVEILPAYIGEVSDDLSAASTKNKSTALCLTDVHQQGDQISGQFSGLGFISTFHGTITQDTVHFSVNIGNDRICSFEGGIRAIGDMAGTFHILNTTGQNLGENGVWEVIPVKVNT